MSKAVKIVQKQFGKHSRCYGTALFQAQTSPLVTCLAHTSPLGDLPGPHRPPW